MKIDLKPLKNIGNTVVKFFKSKEGKAISAAIATAGAATAGAILQDKMKPQEKTSSNEVAKKIAILDKLLSKRKISKEDYDKRLKDVLKTI